MSDLELSNALTHNTKLVLPFMTLRKYGDPNDPLRPQITSRAPPPMSSIARVALIIEVWI